MDNFWSNRYTISIEGFQMGRYPGTGAVPNPIIYDKIFCKFFCFYFKLPIFFLDRFFRHFVIGSLIPRSRNGTQLFFLYPSAIINVWCLIRCDLRRQKKGGPRRSESAQKALTWRSPHGEVRGHISKSANGLVSCSSSCSLSLVGS